MINHGLSCMFIIVLFCMFKTVFYVHINVKQFLPECLDWELNEHIERTSFLIFSIIVSFKTLHLDPIITFAFSIF